MNETLYDSQLFAELYDVQPQAIMWMRPVWSTDGTTITDFEFTYCNGEALKYLNLTREQQQGLLLSVSPTLTDQLRESIMEEMIHVYLTGKPSETNFYNPALNKYARSLRTKLRNGVLTVVQDRTEENRVIKQLEKQTNQLKSQSAYLNSVLNTSLSAVVTMEAIRDDQENIVDLSYRQVNNRFLQWLAKTEDEVINGTMLTLFPYTKESGIFDMYCKVITTGEPIHTETYFQNGEKELWYDLLIARLDENTAVGTFNDITLRKQAFEQVEQQKLLLDNILKNSSNGISVTEVIRDGQGTIIDARTILANDAAVQYTGLSKNDYLSKTAVEIDPNIIGSPYYQLYVKTLETGAPSVLQYHLELTGRWLELTISKMDEDHVIHIFSDITSVKEAQLAIERSATQLQTIINRAQSGIFTISPVIDDKGEVSDFRFVIVNRALATYVHQEPETLVGDTGSKWFSAYKANGLFELFCDTYKTGNTNRFDFHYNSDGIDAWIDMMCTRFEDGILVTFTDFTPVKKLQLELQKLVEELKQSNANLEEFAYVASHDLQEPLRKVSTFSERLKESLIQQLNDKQLSMFDRIEDATKRMRNLIQDLLSYSQASVKQEVYGPVDLDRLVLQVVQDLEALISESGARVVIDKLPEVKGHERQLRQLFQNLIGNALKYHKPGITPEVSVYCRIVTGSDLDPGMLPEEKQGQYYLIEVSDNGIGFRQEDANKIFKVFHRLHGRDQYEGTGIGLAIVQKVVQNHNGYISARGEPGKGATFQLLLPAE